MRLFRTAFLPTGLYLCICFIIIQFSVLRVQAQEIFPSDFHTVSGVIIDFDEKTPVPGVNIYLSNTILGASTDSKGRFTIFNVPSGEYEIIAAHVTYSIQSKKITVKTRKTVRVNFALRKKTFESGEVLVTADEPKQWKKYLKKFEKQFIGETHNADNCIVINPEVLGFSYDKNSRVLSATTHDLLVVENRSLGYRINVYLKHFALTDDHIWYTVKPGFTELLPKNDREEKLWQENRKETFKGSLRHFLTALYLNRTREELFLTYPVEKLPGKLTVETRFLPALDINPDTLVTSARFEGEKHLKFPGYLNIIYTGEEFRNKLAIRNPSMTDVYFYQTSWIKLLLDNVLFNGYGYIYEQEAVANYGYWGMERLADLLPIGFNPLWKHHLERSQMIPGTAKTDTIR